MGMVGLVWLAVALLAGAVQVAVIALAVHLGTASLRRELVELRLDAIYLDKD